MASLDELLARQDHIMKSVHRVLPNFKKLGKAKWNASLVKARISGIHDIFSECRDLDVKLNLAATDVQRATLNYFVANMFYQCEDIYQETVDILATALEDLKAPSTSSNAPAPLPHTSSKPSSHLPQMTLPSFDGALTMWENYRDQFHALIHRDTSLTESEKMHYLKSSLTGEALRAISHLSITDTNYDIAWRILMSRYENKRRLITRHVSTLLHLPHLKSEDVTSLKTLRDVINSSLQALRKLDRPVDAWPDAVILMITSKLAPKTRLAWETRIGDSREMPNYEDMDAFLTSRIQILEAVQLDDINVTIPVPTTTSSGPRTKRFVSHYTQPSTTNRTTDTTTPPPSQCIICSEHHQLHRCQRFLSHAATGRLEIVKRHRLCHDCLSSRHQVAKCPSLYCCRICSHRHHTLLHPPSDITAATTSPPPTASSSIVSSNQAVTHLPSSVLLATARVRVSSSHGRSTVVRALLDQGSTATLISENLAQSLRLQRRRCNLRVAGINDSASVARSTTTVLLSPTDGATPCYTVHTIVLPALTQYTPTRVACSGSWGHTQTLRLSDPEPFNADPIDLIVGADLYGMILREGTIREDSYEPTAQNTVFGWVLSGIVSAHSEASTTPSVNISILESLDSQLRQF